MTRRVVLYLSDYETISNKLTFEEENPEWVPMDIRLRVDPTGETDPVIITKEEASSETGSGKKSSGNTVCSYFSFLVHNPE